MEESVTDKLNYFWNVKAPQISLKSCAQIDKSDLNDP